MCLRDGALSSVTQFKSGHHLPQTRQGAFPLHRDAAPEGRAAFASGGIDLPRGT